MTREFSIRPYNDDDVEEIVQFLDTVFEGWPKANINCTNIEYWRWKYQGSPLPGSCILCTHDGRIIGCQHAIPLRVKVGDRTIIGSTATDWAVHPDFRGRGFSRKISDASDEFLQQYGGSRFNYAITGNPIVIKSLAKRYPYFPHPLINLVKIKDINAQLKVMPVDRPWLMKTCYYVVNLISELRSVLSGPGPRKPDIQITKISRFDGRIDEFWAKISPQYDFIVERSRDYLNWRYCDPRAGEYLIKQAEDGEGTIVGYGVLRINKYLTDYPIGYIIDLISLPDMPEVLDALAADAINYFDKTKTNIVNCQVVKAHTYENVLKMHGFLDSRIKVHLFLDEFGSSKVRDRIVGSPPERIFISWGDHDVLPVKMPNSN